MKLKWTARARTRLAEIHDYIAQHSKIRALAMVERILDRGETLLVARRAEECSSRLSLTTQFESCLKDRVESSTEYPLPASRF